MQGYLEWKELTAARRPWTIAADGWGGSALEDLLHDGNRRLVPSTYTTLPDNMRETEQLFAVARHYLAQAAKILREHQNLAPRTIGDMGRRHLSRSLSDGEMALAHLGSAAVRLATICEITKYRLTPNYRTRFYNPDGTRKPGWSASRIRAALAANPHDHLHLMLRDNVAHEEPGISNTRQIAADRGAVLRNTTIETCEKALQNVMRTVEGSI